MGLASRRKSFPLTVTDPRVGRSRPRISRMVVRVGREEAGGPRGSDAARQLLPAQFVAEALVEPPSLDLGCAPIIDDPPLGRGPRARLPMQVCPCTARQRVARRADSHPPK